MGDGVLVTGDGVVAVGVAGDAAGDMAVGADGTMAGDVGIRLFFWTVLRSANSWLFWRLSSAISSVTSEMCCRDCVMRASISFATEPHCSSYSLRPSQSEERALTRQR